MDAGPSGRDPSGFRCYIKRVMGALSFTHWLIVGLVVVLLFGGKKLGEVGKGLGEGIREFKKGVSGNGDEANSNEQKRLSGSGDERES